jgi:ankyrin repeat protein
MHLLSVLTENNYSRLIVPILQLHTYAEIDTPFFKALVAGHYESITALCRADLKLHPHGEFWSLLLCSIKTLQVKELGSSPRTNTMLCLSWYGKDQVTLACCLASSPQTAINATELSGWTALTLAAAKGYYKLVEMLTKSLTIEIEAKMAMTRQLLIHTARERN